MSLTQEQLDSLAKRGIIAGPGEEEDAFAKRVSKIKACDPIENKTFGFTIDWVPISYSNKKLPFWQAGATWIEDRSSTIQLRSRFKEKERTFLCNKDEVLQHESVHALRSAFEEPVYEEVFAYMTSTQKWRRLVGPLFRSNKELWLLMAVLFFVPLGSLLIIAVQSYRLSNDLKKYKKTRKHLESVTERPNFFILFLTDQEIRLFSVKNGDEIRQFAEEQQCCRWNQLRSLMI